jgi:hypothetical protein
MSIFQLKMRRHAIATIAIAGPLLAACAPAPPPAYPTYSYYPPPVARTNPPEPTPIYEPPGLPSPPRPSPDPTTPPPAPDPKRGPLAGPDPPGPVIDSRAPGTRCDDWWRLSNLWCGSGVVMQ